MSTSAPQAIAHRGASGYEFENSPAALRRAVALGAHGVELDIHDTRDGALVVHHDPALAGLGPIAELTLDQARAHRLPNGEPPPTLSEALGILAGLDVWVEVKTLDPHHDPALLEALAAGPTPLRYAVHSFDHRIVARLGRAAPALRRGALLASYLMDIPAAMRLSGATTLWMEASFIDAALVHSMHAMGASVVAWTVNTEAETRRLVALGVDGICGNYPDRIRAVLDETVPEGTAR